MKLGGPVPFFVIKGGVSMAWKSLTQNQRKVVRAFMDPEMKGNGREVIAMVAKKVKLSEKTIIRYLADEEFLEVIHNINAGLKCQDCEATTQAAGKETTT